MKYCSLCKVPLENNYKKCPICKRRVYPVDKNNKDAFIPLSMF